ncbi:MAG: formyltransferase [Armatimonadetes bacterium]|nr:formyltransferase [Armatimonadota bacterium]
MASYMGRRKTMAEDKSMRIICLAYHTVGHMGLRYFLEETQDKVVAVFTHADDPQEEIWWPSVAQLARSHDIPVFFAEDINQTQWIDLIAELQPDFIFSFWYRQLVKRPILEIPRCGCLNLHGSLLPKYRGRAPVNWVLVNGEQQTGITLHYMVERPDAGDIVGQAVVPIDFRDTAVTLYEKLVEAGRLVLRAAWPLLREGRAPRVPQDEGQATYYGRRTPEDGRFEWHWPALKIYNLVRAVTHPYPGAFVDFGGRKLFVWDAYPTAGLVLPMRPTPGTVQALSPTGIEVATGEGNLLLRRVQLEGEAELTGEQFAEAHGLAVGSRMSPAGSEE